MVLFYFFKKKLWATPSPTLWEKGGYKSQNKEIILYFSSFLISFTLLASVCSSFCLLTSSPISFSFILYFTAHPCSYISKSIALKITIQISLNSRADKLTIDVTQAFKSET